MPPRYTREEAGDAIAASLSYAEALRRLGMCWSGRNNVTLRKWAEAWEIRTDHFDPDAARRKALRQHDAEGRLNVASQYEALLSDRESAMDLLYEAYKIDPNSEEVSQAFLLRGCKKNARGDWVDPQAQRTAAEPAAESPRTAASDQKLRGATDDDVRLRLGGRPNRVVRVATRGQAVEQWIYYNGNQVLYVNFARTPSDSRPRVIAFYSRRRSPSETPPAP